ncbi:MAG: PepSY domain-containing protein [Clostridia bacterium]|nr:PepSY domain-containing protein [Clostridia bacterium]
MKKLLSIMLIAALLLAACAFADSALDATELARQIAPAGLTYLYTEKDHGNYDVYFINDATLEEYKITVNIKTGEIVRLTSDREGSHGGSTITVTDDQAFAKVTADYPDAVLTGVARILEDGLYELRVYFTTAFFYGIYEINSETGEVNERELEYGQAQPGWTETFESDKNEALQDWSTWSESADQKPAAESDSKKNGSSKNDSASSSSFISVSQAKSAVTSRYSGAKITEIEFDREDGKYVYEGEAIYNGREYDFEVDAVTGKLLEWKRD